jgi:UDP-N-acetylglucosamine transferase subunit ALG13
MKKNIFTTILLSLFLGVNIETSSTPIIIRANEEETTTTTTCNGSELGYSINLATDDYIDHTKIKTTTPIFANSWLQGLTKVKRDINLSYHRPRIAHDIEDMAYYLASADVVICRAGAGTISEILSTGAYPILIPSPNVKNNHQFYNARCIADITKTPVLSETQHLTDDVLQEIEYVRNHPSEATGRREKIKSLFRENCAEIILEHIHKEVFYM